MLRGRCVLHQRRRTSSAAAAELSGLLQGPLERHRLLEIHGRVFRIGLHQDDLISTRLIGQHPPQFASRLLRLLVRPGIFPFNAAVRVLADSGDSAAAFSVFNSLRIRSSVLPNGFTFSFLLKACCSSALRIRQVHAQILKHGLEKDTTLGSCVLSAYAKGDTAAAQKLFEETSHRTAPSVSSWSSLIRGFARQDRPEDALFLFLRMSKEGLSPEDETLVAVLSACSKIQETKTWVDLLRSRRRPDNDPLNTILVYFCARLGEIERSRAIFDEIIQRSRERNTRTSIVLWNCMIGGYAQSGYPARALGLFRLLVSSPDHPKPNHVTMASVLPACAELGNLELGRSLHRSIVAEGKKGLLQSNCILATAFIDMYLKCGSPDEGRGVFQGMSKKDVVAFNAMMTGLAVNGQGMAALELFKEMGEIGVQPNGGSYVAALSACSHAGLVEEGHRLFDEMRQRCQVPPTAEHFACYVDLLARAGQVEEAVEAYVTASAEPGEQGWGALLGACLSNSGEEAAREMVAAGPEMAAGYVMLSNAAAAGGRWGEVAGVRGLMAERGHRKQPGCSWITVDGATHEFRIGCLSTRKPPEDHLFSVVLPRVLESLHVEMAELTACS